MSYRYDIFINANGIIISFMLLGEKQQWHLYIIVYMKTRFQCCHILRVVNMGFLNATFIKEELCLCFSSII